MNNKICKVENDIAKYKKKSQAKGQPRSKHKHTYETVLLFANYHHTDKKTGKPRIEQVVTPMKICTICGRVNGVDNDPSYYIEEPITYLPFLYHKKELSEKALNLPRWYLDDYWDKFAHQ